MPSSARPVARFASRFMSEGEYADEGASAAVLVRATAVPPPEQPQPPPEQPQQPQPSLEQPQTTPAG